MAKPGIVITFKTLWCIVSTPQGSGGQFGGQILLEHLLQGATIAIVYASLVMVRVHLVDLIQPNLAESLKAAELLLTP